MKKKSRNTAAILINSIFILLFGCQTSTLSKKNTNYINTPETSLAPSKLVIEKDPEVMMLIPAGTFSMGNEARNEDERPVHNVYVNAFYIDVAEVTCTRYGRFLKETGYSSNQLWNPEYDRPDDPVVGVNWYDATAFAKWAGKRLPTEAEWEKAARSGLIGDKYPWGDEITREKANYNSFGTTLVKSYEPNGYGLYDIAGNVWEWCQDWYGKDYYKTTPRKSPRGPMFAERKVVRGGAWFNNESALQVSNRHKIYPDIGSFNIGFRCVKSLKDVILGIGEFRD